MMKLSSYSGNPYIGVYCVANDKIALVPSDADEQMVSEFREALGVEVVRITVSSSHILGSLVAMNSEGAVVTGQIEASELEKLERHIPVIRIEDKLNAAGNNILINDKGAVVNRNLRPHTVKALENFFGFECIRLRVAGMDTVGSVCKVTNKGGICHPKAT
ncbi:MAG TPA: translation initiation factor IF-6, partial [Candidatus Methanomethylophilaceae archaeon]|nr:translation initiation factor IF-6 [Candidatus Methanomethylophilaceae archaeon]